MSDLDDKLREILHELWSKDGDWAPAIAQIKQVFEEAGYIKEVDISMPAITPYKPTKHANGLQE